MTKLVHCNKDKYDVYIGRPSKWGNPYTHIMDKDTLAEYVVATRDEAIEKYREYIENNAELLADLDELEGKVLGCWCYPKSCHGEILMELLTKRKIKKFFKK